MSNPNSVVEVEEGNKTFRLTEQKVEHRDPEHGLDPMRVRRVWSERGAIHYSIGGQEMSKDEYFAKASGK